MTEEEKKKESGEISRREFLKDAGLVVGGAAIGSTVLLAACGEGEVTTETVTTTTTVTQTVSKYVCPYDGMEFDTLSALEAHLEAVHGGEEPEWVLKLKVNSKVRKLPDVKPWWSLAFVLREKLGLPGTKIGCDRGSCGTCTVIVDGRAVYSCMMLAMEADGMDIETVEGLSDGITLSPVQQACYDIHASQCGYCTPGFLMAATALLDKKPSPTRDEVREALSGHICICGEIKHFIDAVLSA